jgi:hypothetical protein
VSWACEFDDPIELPKGRKWSRCDVLNEIAEDRTAGRQVAAAVEVEALILVTERNGPTMLARIGVMRALNRHGVREFRPARKATRWGKRKMKGDQ